MRGAKMCGHLMHQFIRRGWFGLNVKKNHFPRLINSNRALSTTIAILYTTIHCFRYTTSHPLQTQDSKFKLWRSGAEHTTSRSWRLLAILSFTSGWGRNIFVSFKPPGPGGEPRTLARKAVVLINTTLGPPPFLGTDVDGTSRSLCIDHGTMNLAYNVFLDNSSP